MRLKLVQTLLIGIIIQTGLICQTILEPAMVYVKGGSFMMGHEDDDPIHRVTLSDFNIGKYEGKVSEYKAFCTATSRTMPDTPPWGWNDNHPIVNTSYEDAVAYCKWLSKKTKKNYRLPTEAEWEYAARGGQLSKGYTYAGSDDLDDVAWYENKSGEQPSSVGRKKPNELGLYDMSGNVWEWCNDWYEDYTSSAKTNPRGPTSGTYRLNRGGGWGYSSYSCRVASRDGISATFPCNCHGFRVVSSLQSFGAFGPSL